MSASWPRWHKARSLPRAELWSSHGLTPASLHSYGLTGGYCFAAFRIYGPGTLGSTGVRAPNSGGAWRAHWLAGHGSAP